MSESESKEEQVKGIKGQIDALETQIATGKSEAVKEFEAQKEVFNQKLEEVKGVVDGLSEKGKAKIGDFKTYLEELQVQMALGKAESIETFHEQEQKMQTALHSFREKSKETFEATSQEGEEKVKEIMAAIEQQTVDFKGKMESFRLQFSLGEAEAKEKLEELRKNFMENAREVGAAIEGKMDMLEDKAEEIGDGIAEKLQDAKKSITNLFN